VKVAELIPQIFYDVIARVTAGLVLMFSWSVVWWADSTILRRYLVASAMISPLYTVIGLVIVGYVIAILFEGTRGPTRSSNKESGNHTKDKNTQEIWELCWEELKHAFQKSHDRALPELSEGIPNRPTEAIAIDVIRLKSPAVGARLVKLRAELAMCKTLFAGWAATLLVFVIFTGCQYFGRASSQGFDFERATVVVLLSAVVAMIWARHRTLDERYLRSLFNHWLLIVLPEIRVCTCERGCSCSDSLPSA